MIILSAVQRGIHSLFSQPNLSWYQREVTKLLSSRQAKETALRIAKVSPLVIIPLVFYSPTTRSLLNNLYIKTQEAFHFLLNRIASNTQLSQTSSINESQSNLPGTANNIAPLQTPSSQVSSVNSLSQSNENNTIASSLSIDEVLPSEVLFHVFSLSDLLPLQQTIPLVSHSWNTLANDRLIWSQPADEKDVDCFIREIENQLGKNQITKQDLKTIPRTFHENVVGGQHLEIQPLQLQNQRLAPRNLGHGVSMSGNSILLGINLKTIPAVQTYDVKTQQIANFGINPPQIRLAGQLFRSAAISDKYAVFAAALEVQIYDVNQKQLINTISFEPNDGLIESLALSAHYCLIGFLHGDIELRNLENDQHLYTFQVYQNETYLAQGGLGKMVLSNKYAAAACAFYPLQETTQETTIQETTINKIYAAVAYVFRFLQKTTIQETTITITKVKVWDIETGNCLSTLQTGKVNDLAIWENHIITAPENDRTVQVWDCQTGAKRHTFEGHTATVNSLAILHHYVISGSNDGTIKIWNLKTLKLLGTIQVGAEITNVTASGKYIIFKSQNAIRIYDLLPDSTASA